MTVITGKNAKVMYGAVTIAEQVAWALSGYVQSVEEVTSFGDNVKRYELSDAGDAGKITFSGNYDPTDSAGQQALATQCKTGVKLTTLYLYVNTSTFWRIAAGGNIIVTKCDAVQMQRSKVGKISFEGQPSAAAMEQIGTGT